MYVLPTIMLPPMVPQEIVDLIIDWLNGSQSTLKSCCLVCSSWLPRARYNLFCRLSLDLRFRTSPGEQIIHQLRTDILSNSSIIWCIQELSLSLRYTDQPRPDSPYEILPNIPFINLRRIHINFACCFITEEHPWRLSRLIILLRNNPDLEYLSFRNFGIDAQSLHEIFLALSKYSPHIKTLIMDDVLDFIQRDNHHGDWPPPSHPISLKNLLLFEGRGPSHLMDFVFRSRGVFDWDTIQSLALTGYINREGIEALIQSSCGSSVSSFALDLRGLLSNRLRARILENFSQVKNLHLILTTGAGYGLLLHTLEQLEQSSNLQQSHRLESLQISNATLISPLDEQLARLASAIPSLRNVSFGSWWSQPDIVDSTQLECYLPLTSKTGTLALWSGETQGWWYDALK